MGNPVTITWRRFALPVLVLSSVFIFMTCGVREIEDPLSTPQYKISQLSSLYGATGLEKTEFYTYETVFLSLEELFPRRQTDIQVIRLSDNQTIKRLIVITDGYGKLSKIPIWYHVGTDANGSVVDESGDYLVHVLQHSEHNPWMVLNIPFKVLNSALPSVQIRGTRADGTFLGGSALVGEAIHAAGSGFAAGVEVRLYVVQDNNQYNAGDLFVDESGGSEAVITQADGSIANTQIWAAVPAAGSFDIIADTAPFGEYNNGDAVSEIMLTGLLIQQPPTAADIVTDIACDVACNYTDTFDELDPIWACVNPLGRPSTLSECASVYVVIHKDVWNVGDPLVSITTIGSMSMPTHCLANPMSGGLSPILIRGSSKAGYNRPLSLWPGDYDVVVDMDRNGVYDPGTDILDGGPQVGFTIAGTPPDVRLIASADIDFIGRYVNETKVWVQLVRADNAPVVGIPVGFNIASGPGALLVGTAVTDANGLANTTFTGAEYGKRTLIHIQAIVDGTKYTCSRSIYRKVPHTHTQAILVTG